MPRLRRKRPAPHQERGGHGLSNKVGTIAMACTMEPHSASAQFFINVNNNDFPGLQVRHHPGLRLLRFGEVTAGMDVVNKIRA